MKTPGTDIIHKKPPRYAEGSVSPIAYPDTTL